MTDTQGMKDSRAEHFTKYEALAREIGIRRLVEVLGAPPLKLTRERVQGALERGDEHLNSIPLQIWDVATGYDTINTASSIPMEKCHCCGSKVPAKASTQAARNRTFHNLEPFASGPFTASERTCVLKHVARYYIDRLLSVEETT